MKVKHLITDLPNEIILKISEYLDTESYVRFRTTNRSLFNQLTEKTPVFLKMCRNRDQYTKSQNDSLDKIIQVMLECYETNDEVEMLRCLWTSKSMDFSFTKFSDVSVLSGLENIQKLNLRHTQITDISALSTLPKLQKLDLSRTPISDLSALSTFTNIEIVYLDQCNVILPFELLRLVNLRKIVVDENQSVDSVVLKEFKSRGVKVVVKRMRRR